MVARKTPGDMKLVDYCCCCCCEPFWPLSLFHSPPLVFHVLSIGTWFECTWTCTALEVDLWRNNNNNNCKSPIMAFQNAIYYCNFTRTILLPDQHRSISPRSFHVNILFYSHISPFHVNYCFTFFAASIRGDSSWTEEVAVVHSLWLNWPSHFHSINTCGTLISPEELESLWPVINALLTRTRWSLITDHFGYSCPISFGLSLLNMDTFSSDV